MEKQSELRLPVSNSFVLYCSVQFRKFTFDFWEHFAMVESARVIDIVF